MKMNDDVMFKFMQDVREGLGALKADICNAVDHIEAVNTKLNVHIEDFHKHVGDDQAHGLGTAERRDDRSRSRTQALVTIIISVAALIAAFWQVLRR